LEAFRGKTLVLPDVRVMTEKEVAAIHAFAKNGGRVVIDGAANKALEDVDHAVRLPQDPARVYLSGAEHDYAGARAEKQTEFLEAVGPGDGDDVQVRAGSDVVAHTMRIGGRAYVFLSNFSGIEAGVKLTPTIQTDVRVMVPASLGTTMHVLPFLGTETVVSGERVGERVSFAVPALERGMVVWFR
jgi:hypothetical protein